MNFIDKVLVDVKAGDGGNGGLSFRQEKFVDRGGPDGGDGGRGGHVIFQASRNQNTLAAFRYQREIRAQPGDPGTKRNKHGRNGKDQIVAIPVGTIISTEEGTVLADLATDGQEVIIAKGGRGGFGNAHFVSSVRQAPANRRYWQLPATPARKSPIIHLRQLSPTSVLSISMAVPAS